MTNRTESLLLLIGICIGLVVGALIRLPLVPWIIPDYLANALSAAAGAAFAVFGAAWLVEHRERQHRDELEEVVGFVTQPLRNALAEVVKISTSSQSFAHKKDLIARKLKKLKMEYQLVGPRVDEMKPLFLGLGPKTVLQYLRLGQVRYRVELLIAAIERGELTEQSVDGRLKAFGRMATRALGRLDKVMSEVGADTRR